MQGWVAIHRSILEHWLHTDIEKFGAWIDLILMANHEENKFYAKTGLITVNRGQLVTSYRSLSDRWGWSKDKVAHFINTLESDGMLQRNQDKGRTVLTITKYGFYQDLQDSNRTKNGRKSDSNRTENGQETDANRTQIGRNNNDNNENNENNDNNENNENKKCVPKKSFGTFNHVKLTEDELNRLKGDFGEGITEQAITFLDAYIEEKGYKSKSHNLAIRRWVINAVKENQAKQTKANRTQPQEQESIAERWANVK